MVTAFENFLLCHHSPTPSINSNSPAVNNSVYSYKKTTQKTFNVEFLYIAMFLDVPQDTLCELVYYVYMYQVPPFQHSSSAIQSGWPHSRFTLGPIAKLDLSTGKSNKKKVYWWWGEMGKVPSCR